MIRKTSEVLNPQWGHFYYNILLDAVTSRVFTEDNRSSPTKKVELIRIIQESDILMVVDIQRDLLPNGANAVPDGQLVLPPILRICPLFEKIVVSVLSFQPGHPILKQKRYCVAGSWGAEFPHELLEGLVRDKFENNPLVILYRGRDPSQNPNQYGFKEGGRFTNVLRKYGGQRIFICGLTLDEEIREIALTLKETGFEVIILEDAVRSRNNQAGLFAKQDLQLAGIQFIRTSAFFKE